MKVDMHGCYDADVHAICIHKDGKFITVRPRAAWSDSLENCACFLSERKALLAIEELRAVEELAIDEANLVWTDTLRSIYADLEGLREFEKKQIMVPDSKGLY